MTGSVSITRRLVVTVLLLELLSAVALIGAITVHEWSVQLKVFDASLVATAESLMGAVQDTEDESDNVMLDMRGVRVAENAAYRVEDERGRVLGSAGDAPYLEGAPSGSPVFRNVEVNAHDYRFLILNGVRIVDPGQSNGGVRHSITIVYGTPVRRVWREVREAIRFFAIATAFLLGVTAVLMAWLVRKGLSPVRELAREAERISSSDWQFHAPVSAKETMELRPLAAALEAALARLQRSFEQQRRFTSDAAHELKTDMAIVKSSLQLLSLRKRTLEEYEQGLALSLEDFTRLESTVEEMLTLARLEQPLDGHRLATPRQFCSLRDTIEDAVQQSKPFAQLKSVEIAVDFSGDVSVPIDGRDALLLCSNILLNALQHSPEGVAVRIAAHAEERTVRLTVQDQGPGISGEDHAHIFEPFYRGDPSRSRKSGGTGLGLSICKAICERVGGSIEIANRPAGGALVTVRLPAKVTPFPSTHSASLKAE
jgi:signal transduction histidine kinase